MGDPFCLVAPQEIAARESSVLRTGDRMTARLKRPLEGGQFVQFTGTFLRMVRYLASDGGRLAPLVVGNRAPVCVTEAGRKAAARSSGIGDLANSKQNNSETSVHRVWSSETYTIGLLVISLVIGAFTWQHLRLQSALCRAQLPKEA